MTYFDIATDAGYGEGGGVGAMVWFMTAGIIKSYDATCKWKNESDERTERKKLLFEGLNVKFTSIVLK